MTGRAVKGRKGADPAGAFASLCPTLLARKGGARPAMRPQLDANRFGDAQAQPVDLDSDLGWNDFGDPDLAGPDGAASAQVVPIAGDGAAPPASAALPAVMRQRKAAEQRITASTAAARVRRSALEAGRKAAFTLRLDAERHLKLRLACTVDARSAQQVVTEALDRLLDDMPDIAALADRVGKRRQS